MKRVLALVLSLMMLLTSFATVAVADEKQYVTVTYEFYSPVPVYAFGVYLDIPEGLKYDSASASAGTVGPLSWSFMGLPGLTPGATSATCTYTFEVTGGEGVYTVNARLAFAEDADNKNVDAAKVTSNDNKVIVGDHAHTPGEPVRENIKLPDCKTPGSYEEVISCTVCGEEISREPKSLPLAACTPKAPVQENVKASDCKTAGSYDEVVYCSVCGKEISRVTKPLPLAACTPKAPVQENRVEPDCETAGSYESVVYCAVCGEELSRTTVAIDALGHTPEEKAEIPADCENGGQTAGTFCSVCGITLTGMEPTEALGHTAAEAVKENIVEADCKTAGSYDEVVYCSVCNKELSRVTVTVDPTNEHVTGEAVVENEVAPTCGTEGSYDNAVYCTVCGKELFRDTIKIEATGAHVEGEAVKENEVAATCTTAGSYDEVVYCTVCNTELDRETITVDALAHTEKEIPAVAPTCTETGLTAGVECEVCGEILTAQTEVAALGHTLEVIPGKAATCEEPGLTDGEKCSVCGTITIEQKDIAVQDHEWDLVAPVEPTCEEDGLTVGVACKVCEKVLIEQKVVPACHPEDKELIIEPTCTEEGKTICDMCGEVLVVHPALGHEWYDVAAKEPTYTDAGNTAGQTCGNCGETTVEILDKLEATGTPKYSVEKISETRGKIEFIGEESDKVLSEVYVKLSWSWDLSDGSSFAFTTTRKVDEDGTFKLSGATTPSGATLKTVFVEVVDDADADEKLVYDVYGFAFFTK